MIKNNLLQNSEESQLLSFFLSWMIIQEIASLQFLIAMNSFSFSFSSTSAQKLMHIFVHLVLLGNDHNTPPDTPP